MAAGWWSKRWARLAGMEQEELLDRVRQQVMARADAVAGRMGVRWNGGLRSGTVRAPQFYFAAGEIPGLCELLKQRLPGQVARIVQQADSIRQHRFDLLGYEGLDYGAEIDWHLDRAHQKRAPRKAWYRIRYLDFAEAGDVKVTWELNRHQHLVTLAKAYRLTGDAKYAAEIFAQWKHWHRENPYPVGVNWASSLEVAFRSLSWLWMKFLLAGTSAEPKGFEEEWLAAMAVNGRHVETYLSTYFSANTHLLGEAVALFFIGTLCPQLRSAERWRRSGWEMLIREMRRQLRADGMHFEQSVYYHVYALDMFLHSCVLAASNGQEVSDDMDRGLEAMLDALARLSRAGAPPSIGDDDGGRLFDGRRNRSQHMLDPLATGAVLYERGDFKFLAEDLTEETVWLMGETGVARFDAVKAAPMHAKSAALAESGLYMMCDAGQAQQIVIDAGPQGAASAGHGHSDALGVWVSRDGRGVLVDAGTAEYVGEGGDRDEFRSTAAHNTMTVDEASQSEPAGPFAWQGLTHAKAERWVSGESFDLFTGSHDGYERLASPVTHRRWVFARKGGLFLVRDCAMGQGTHRLDVNWNVGPDFSSGEGLDGFTAGEQNWHAVGVDDARWTRQTVSRSWSPVYGRKAPLSVLNFSTVTSLPAEFATLFAVGKGQAGRLERLAEPAAGNRVSAYRYRSDGEEHYFFFGEGSWRMGPWASDAAFVYWGRERAGVSRLLVLCGATYLELDRQRVISCERAVSWCEVRSSEQETEIVSPERNLISVQAPEYFGDGFRGGQPTFSSRTGV